MEEIKSCAIIVCVTSVVIALIKNFIPSQKFEQPIKLLLSAFAVLAIITPLSNLKIDFPEFTEKSIKQNYEYEEKAAILLSDQVSMQLSTKLRQVEIEALGINSVVKIDGEKGIYVQTVCIDISSKYITRKKEIENLVFQEVGIYPEIELKGEDDQNEN